MRTTLRLALRDALRSARRFRVSTAVAFVVIAASIAAATLTFSIVDTVVLRHLPYPDDDRLVAITGSNAGGVPIPIVSPVDYDLWRGGTDAFTSLAAWRAGSLDTGRGDQVRTLRTVQTTANLFDALRVPPLLGETFSAADERSDRSVAVISHGFWQRQFGRDPQIVGRSIDTAEGPVRIVGVMPPGFTFPVDAPHPIDLWQPLAIPPGDRTLTTGRTSYLEVVGRLRDGVTLPQARAEIERLSAAQAAAFPLLYSNWRVHVTTLLDSLIGAVRGWMLLVLAAVGLVLIVACANVATMLLARASGRARDIAVRAALGATRRQIVQSLLVESLLLSCVSAAAGIALAYLGLATVTAWLPDGIARASQIALDARVLGVACAAAIATGLLFGTVPALQASRADVVDTLKDGGGVTGCRLRTGWRSAFLIGEAALVTALLVATTLIVGSFIEVQRVDLGFDAERLIAITVSAPSGGTPESAAASRREIYARVSAALKATPGVASIATVVGGAPLNPIRMTTRLTQPYRPAPPITAELRRVSPGFFTALGSRVVAGRDFTDDDETAAVVVLNERAAASLFPQGGAVGGTVLMGKPQRVIGVVEAIRSRGPEFEAAPQAYVPIASVPPSMQFVMRTSLPPAGMIGPVDDAVRLAMPTGGVQGRPQTFVERFRNLTAGRRFNASVMAVFGVLALLIGITGVYGVTASIVAQQTREIGIRMALGASAMRIVRGVTVATGRLLLVGAALGLGAAWAAASVLSSILFGLQPRDLIAYVVPLLLLVLAGAAATILPALRVSRVDPMSALRID
jgi:predicted permease